jgi:hypothetical protein
LYSKCSYLYTDIRIELQIYASKTPHLNEVFLMYFTIKYNVFYKYIINATTTEINACKKVI